MQWFGQPVPGARAGSGNLMFRLLFGGIFAGVGLVSLSIGLVTWGGDPMFNIVFIGIGVLFVLIGGGSILIPPILQARRMRKLRYGLSDRRAFVFDGQGIRGYDITPETPIEIRPGSPGSIIFGYEMLNITLNDVPATREIGFIGVPDLVEVAQMIRDIQSATPPSVPKAMP